MSSSALGLDAATLLSTTIESVLYGISLALFGGTVWALTHKRPKAEVNRSLVLIAFIFMILSTIHLIVNIQRLIYGFTHEVGILDGPADFFADMTQSTFIIKSATYVLQTLFGDGVVIYRCYVVWQRFAFIMLPVGLWCAVLVTSSGFLYNLPYAADIKGAFLLDTGKWLIPFFLLTMATNVVSSALLAYGVWSVDRDEPGVTRVPSRSGIQGTLLLRALVDSAVLYTLSLFLLLVCCAYQSTGQFIILDMMTPIISITFYIVLVRIAVAKHDSTLADVPVLSPVCFAPRVLPSDPEPTLITPRRSSI